jgi:hypothetical protein
VLLCITEHSQVPVIEAVRCDDACDAAHLPYTKKDEGPRRIYGATPAE